MVQAHLDLLDAQREAALAAVADLTEAQLWQRPAPRAWSIGEMLHHNYRLMHSAMLYIRPVWQLFGWWGRRQRHRPYLRDIPDLYRQGNFPMWVGFLWRPRYNARRPLTLAQLQAELRQLHSDIRTFYMDKEEDILGNLYLFDPYFGWLNLITSLRLGIHHDQLHYEDVIALARAWRTPAS